MVGMHLIEKQLDIKINKVEKLVGWVGRDEGLGEVVSDNMP